jgi:hypothetical protein
VRFTADEYAELAAAAARAGLTPTGYVGEVALAAARGVTAEGGIDPGAINRAVRPALSRLATQGAVAGVATATAGSEPPRPGVVGGSA